MLSKFIKVIAFLVIPFVTMGLITSDTYADASTIPEDQPFTDINFYNCVVDKIGRWLF